MAKRSASGYVYSTNPNFQAENLEESTEFPSPAEQVLHVHRETKGRGGKAVVIVRNLQASKPDADALAKSLKAHCGCGGSNKDGEILIQGDQREKVMEYLAKAGYKTKRVGG